MTFESVYVDPRGRISRREYIPALATLLAAMLFFGLLVGGRTAQFCLLVLLYPAVALHARRLHDMGRPAWALAVPAVLLILTQCIRLGYFTFGPTLDVALPIASLVVSAVVVAWCLAAPGQAEPNRFGPPLAA